MSLRIAIVARKAPVGDGTASIDGVLQAQPNLRDAVRVQGRELVWVPAAAGDREGVQDEFIVYAARVGGVALFWVGIGAFFVDGEDVAAVVVRVFGVVCH